MSRDPNPQIDLPDDGRTNEQRMRDGDWYRVEEGIVALHMRAHHAAEQFAEAYSADPHAAQALLSDLFGSVGESPWVRPPLFLDLGTNVHLGSRVEINFGLTALDVAPITIGDDVLIGPQCQLLTPLHPLAADPRKAGLESADPITIGNNVWLGGGVIVLPGVTIGDNTVIGAGSVVTTDIPAGVLAVGNPARVIRHL